MTSFCIIIVGVSYEEVNIYNLIINHIFIPLNWKRIIIKIICKIKPYQKIGFLNTINIIYLIIVTKHVIIKNIGTIFILNGLIYLSIMNNTSNTNQKINE